MENSQLNDEGVRMKPWHMLVCGGLVAIGVVLAVAGASAFAFLPALGCAAMMGMMVWMMVRGHGH
jgi:hypothetical protein